MAHCPACRSAGSPQRIPALFAGGHSTTYSSGTVVGFARGQLVTGYSSSATRTVSTLAAALRPEPTLKKGGCVLPIAVLMSPMAVLAAVAAFNTTDTHGSPAGRFIAWLFFASPCLVALGLYLQRVRHRLIVRRGRSAAYRLWDQGWYCHRCGGCYFSDTAQASGAQLGVVLLPDQFRSVVWSAGGYGHLRG